MADKSFGVKELNLLNASGTPTVTSPNNLNLNANTVAISTSATVGNNLTVTSTTNSANLNVTGVGTLTRAFATDLSVSGISTISQPSNANPHSLWDVVNNSSSAYRFTGPGQSGDENNPNIYLVRGQRYIFKVNASGHPFQLRVANGGAAYTDGVTNNGAQSGNVVLNVQHDAPAQLYYQCTNHGGMVGNIYIVGGPQVIAGVVTATTFVGALTGNPTGSGANLTNLPAANLTGTLPAISGANLTSLPAQATIANNADNRVITGGSGVNLNGESGLTYNGTRLDVTTGDLQVIGGEGGNAELRIVADQGDDGADYWRFQSAASGNNLNIATYASGAWVDKVSIDSSGRVGVNQATFATSDTMFSVSEISGHCEIGIISKNDSAVVINMGDTDSYNQGRIKYNNSDNSLTFRTVGSDRLRIGSAGQFGIGGATYGTAGQVLTSGGASAAPTWATPSGGMTLLTSATLSSSGTVAANLSFSTTGYEYLYGKIYSISRSGSANISDIGLRWNGSSSALYDYVMQRQDSNGSGSSRYVQGGNQFYINMQGVAAYTSGINQAVFELHLVNDGVRKPFNMKHGGKLSGGSIVLTTDGFFDSTSAITSLEVSSTDTDINGGTIKLYGVK